MGSKILSYIDKVHEFKKRFVIVNGWTLRLVQKRIKKNKFENLTEKQRREIRDFWKKYKKKVSPDWAAYYSYGSKKFDPKYIPESLFYGEICQKLNDFNLSGLGNKNVQEQIFSSVQPKTIVRKIGGLLLSSGFKPISKNDTVQLIEKAKSVIIKPSSGTYGGKGIIFWSIGEDYRDLELILDGNMEFIIQEIVEQHPFFRNIHPNSLNTLRIVSLIINDKPTVLSTLLRMGKNKSKIDNYSAGGIIAVVDEEGILKKQAVQSDQSVITQHPDGFIFENKVIPFFDRIISDVVTQHYRIPYFKFISWDYSLTPDGIPVLIEANFPTSQIDLHQINIGPIFGDYTDRVLDYVYNNGKL